MANLLVVRPVRLDEMKGRFTKAQRAIVEAMEEALDEYGETFVKELRKRTPVRTGRLRESATYIIRGRGKREMQLEVRIGGKDEPKLLPVWLEFGTGIYGPRRHPVVPRRAKFLRFAGRNGRIIFARSVRGIKPRRFFSKTEKATESARRRLAGRIGKLAIEKLTDPRL